MFGEKNGSFQNVDKINNKQIKQFSYTYQIKQKERTVDALALRDDEGRN